MSDDAKTFPTEAQIKHMVSRFLGWQLPDDFRPDGGVTYTPIINAYTGKPYPIGPSGTNLLHATQAEAMVRHMVAEMPAPTCKACGGNDAGTPCAYPSDGVDGCLRDKRLYGASPSATRQR